MSFIPKIPTPNYDPQYLADLEQRIFNAFKVVETPQIRITLSYAEPSKKTIGDIVNADGTYWNPGSGAGLYEYDGTTWNKL